MTNVVPEDWKTMDEFAEGIDGNRLPPTSALSGTGWRIDRAGGTRTDLRFTSADEVEWSTPTDSGTDWYQAIEVSDGVFFVDQTYADRPYTSDVTVAHLASGRTITIRSVIAEHAPEGKPRVSQEFLAGTIGAPTGPEPGPTRDLIGWRALYRYSPNHLYEHVYLSSERYCWQCLVGEQRGHGDVDLATTWKLAENFYVFTFREFLIPVAATWLYDLSAMRSTGKFFGLAHDGAVHNSPGGAHITSLGRAKYPGERPI